MSIKSYPFCSVMVSEKLNVMYGQIWSLMNCGVGHFCQQYHVV